MTKKLTKRSSRVGRPTAEQSRERHHQLLDSALEIFLKKGYELTTMDDIAASMRMTKRTIYSLYESKEALFRGVVRMAIAPISVDIDELRKLETDDLETTLTAIAKFRINLYVSPRGIQLQRILNGESYRFPELPMLAFTETAGPTIAFLKEIFEKHSRAGEITVERVDVTAAIFLSIAVGVPSKSIVYGSALARNMDDQISYCIRTFLNGIRAH